jgi:tetratricopeptide (TPR) repeat protein
LGYSNQTTKAKEKLREKLENEPSDIYATNQLGILYFQEGDYSQALEYFKKHLELEPNNPLAYDNLGYAYEKLNQPEAAADIYLMGVLYDFSFYEKAIKIYLDLQDFKSAQKIYNDAKQVEGNWDFANPNLNFLLEN